MASFYATGTATDLNDLMTKFKDHLVNDAGYTLDSFITEGTGKRLHVHKNSMYFNFRSFSAESTPVGGTTQSGVFMNAGTGYSGATPWYDQAGVLKYNSNTNYLLPGMVQLSSAIVAYHFYYYSAASDYDVIYFFVEAPAGTYQRLLFGRLATDVHGTHWDTPPEGMFYQGSQAHTTSAYSNTLNLFGENQSGYWFEGRAKGAVYGTVNSVTAWMSGDFSIPNSQFSPLRSQCFDSIMRTGSLWLATPNSFNSAPIQLPITICVTLDTAALTTSNPNVPWCPVGELPFMYWINLLNINPSSNISISTDTYKVFPFRKKSDTWNSSDVNIGTYRFGLSVKNV